MPSHGTARPVHRWLAPIAASAALFWAVPAVAGDSYEIEVGVTYESGTNVHLGSLHATFEIPRGWRGVLPEAGASFVMQNQTGGTVVVTGLRGTTPKKLAKILKSKRPLGGGVVLRPYGRPRRHGKRVYARYRARIDGKKHMGHAAAHVEEGTGVTFLVFGPSREGGRYDRLARSLVSSLRFCSVNKPRGKPIKSKKWRGPLRGRRARSGPWGKRLRGKSLLRDAKKISFCSNGDAVWGRENGYLTGTGDHGGVWMVEKDTLTIAWNDGTAYRWKLSEASDGVVRLNRKPWRTTDESVCR